MGSAPFERVRRFFLEARSLPPDRRAAFLDSACADDPLTRQEVEELLIADADSRTFSPEPAPRLQLGAVQPTVAGYEIGGRLGEGGMGVVWAAIQQSTHRRVALKVMSESAFGSTRRQGRFIREVEVAASLQHPNIARVYDSGLDRGVYYYVMELVEGEPLDLFVKSRKLGQRRILDLMLLVCQAMQYAHQRGIIHRDLKPSNILVDKDGQPHILDFGLAKFLDSDLELSLSIDGEVAGTPMYMSPEQAAGKSELVDTRSDVYALGVLLYRLLTGDAPHGQSATYVEMIRRVAEQEVRRPRAVAPGIDRELETILLKALAHESDERYSSAGELGEDIRRFVAQEPINAQATSLTYVLRKRLRKHRVAAIATGAALLILVGMVIAAYVRVSMERTLEQAARNEAVAARTLESQQRQIAEQRGRELREHLYLAQMSLAGESANLPTGMSQVSETLSAWVRGRPDLRGWEWYYLDSLCRSDLLTLRGHNGRVVKVIWRPDGRQLASAGEDGTIRVWDASAGRELRVIQTGIGMIRAFSWSHDSTKAAAVAWNGQLRILDVESGETIGRFTVGDRALNAVALSPDGLRVAVGGEDGIVTLLDVATGGQIFSRVAHVHPMSDVAWSPDGKRLASASVSNSGNSDKETIKIWDTETGSMLQTIAEDGTSLEWSQDGKVLARGGNNWVVRIYSPETGKQLFGQSHGGQVLTVTLNPDATRIASAGRSDWVIKIWDVPGNKLAFSLRGHRGQINSVAWSPTGEALASASDDGTVKVWASPRDNATSVQPLLLKGHAAKDLGGGSDWVESVAWRPDGAVLATGARDLMIKLWNPATGEEITTLKGQTGWVYALAWSPDGRQLASGGSDHKIMIWDIANEKQICQWQANDEVRSLDFSPDGTRLLSGDSEACIWDIASGNRTQLSDHSGSANSVQWSPDGQSVAAGFGDRSIKVWDATTHALRWSNREHANIVRAIKWSPDGRRLASSGVDQTIRIWDAADGHALQTLRGHTELISGLSWNPDGTRLASASMDSTVKIWDTMTGALALTLQEGATQMDQVAFSPDGMQLAATGRVDRVAIHNATIGYAADASPALLPALAQKLKVEPQSSSSLAIRARAHARLGDWDKAAADARDYLAIDTGARWVEAGRWVAGPYPADLSGNFGPERQLDSAKLIDGAGSVDVSTELYWEPAQSDTNGYSDITALVPMHGNASIYMMLRVFAPKQTQAGVLTSGPTRLWANGRLAYQNLTTPASAPATYDGSIALQPGWNTILARMVCQSSIPRLSLRPI